jgi:formylglycine-generating enzyme required for sulfatase activity
LDKGLNDLSKIYDLNLIKILKHLFPGHKFKANYRLPTEAEFEFTARLGGLADGSYPFGNYLLEDITQYIIYSDNSYRVSHPLGEKKPVFYNGKPLYDLTGNVWAWVSDVYDDNISGGVDPQGPPLLAARRIVSDKFNRTKRGGSFDCGPYAVDNSHRFYQLSDTRNKDVGFRLVRDIK